MRWSRLKNAGCCRSIDLSIVAPTILTRNFPVEIGAQA